MNKILRKCKDFGLIVRLNNITIDQALTCVRSLKKGDIPLCLIDKNLSNWDKLLREIAFNEDLFIAVENISTLEEAYLAAGNGAQFFILNDADLVLMKELKENGFFFIPRVKNTNELDLCKELNLECILPITSDIYRDSNLYSIEDIDNPTSIKHSEKTLFSIINIPENCYDYELWINSIVKDYLGINFTTVEFDNCLKDNTKQFAHIFAALNKCKIINGQDNCITMECRNLHRTISYLKWKHLYVNPDSVEMIDEKIIKADMDSKLGHFKIVIVEKE